MNIKSLFDGHSIKYKPRLEGQTVSEEGVVYIGDRAGPSIDLSNLCHEMAHCVEIEFERLTEQGYGLRYPHVYIINRMCIDPATMQMTEREMRVIAYQANIMDHFGIDGMNYQINSMQYLPDFCFVPIENGMCAYDENNDFAKSLSYSQTTNSRLKWLAQQIDQLREIFTFKRFINNWEEIDKKLKNNGKR